MDNGISFNAAKKSKKLDEFMDKEED